MSPQLLHTPARVLEFESLRALLRGFAPSPLGQSRIANLTPSTDAAWVQTQQQLATEIREFRRVGGRFDFAGLIDIQDLVEQARITGVALETTQDRKSVV